MKKAELAIGGVFFCLLLFLVWHPASVHSQLQPQGTGSRWSLTKGEAEIMPDHPRFYKSPNLGFPKTVTLCVSERGASPADISIMYSLDDKTYFSSAPMTEVPATVGHLSDAVPGERPHRSACMILPSVAYVQIFAQTQRNSPSSALLTADLQATY